MRTELSDQGKTLALKLLGEWNSHIDSKSLWKSLIDGFYLYYDNKHPEPFPALHCISYFGISDITDTLIQMNRFDVN